MSYSRQAEKKYEQPHPPAGLKGKPGFKPKGAFEKDLISRATESIVKDKNSEETK